MPITYEEAKAEVAAYKKGPNRKLPAWEKSAIKGYTQATGEVVWSANKLQMMLGMIFGALIVRGGDDDPVGPAIWNSIKTDSAQRTC